MLKEVVKTGIKLALNRGVGSQFDEDEILSCLLPERGFYVDVGAYHPHLYSNTYHLYKKGWHGIVIEPNKDMEILYKIFRPRDIFINVGIGSGEQTYSRYTDGAYNGFNTTVPNRVKLVSEEKVQLCPLSEIVDVPKIDFLSIDIQGCDLQALESHNWDIPIDVIAVEGDGEKDAVTKFLENKNYTLHSITGETLIFV